MIMFDAMMKIDIYQLAKLGLRYTKSEEASFSHDIQRSPKLSPTMTMRDDDIAENWLAFSRIEWYSILYASRKQQSEMKMYKNKAPFIVWMMNSYAYSTIVRHFSWLF